MKFTVRLADASEMTLTTPTIFGAMNITDIQYRRQAVLAIAMQLFSNSSPCAKSQAAQGAFAFEIWRFLMIETIVGLVFLWPNALSKSNAARNWGLRQCLHGHKDAGKKLRRS